jgi:predicted DNA binding CopG/RHH family protein
MMAARSNKKRQMVIPRFASPSAEAEWFDKNRSKLEADMSRRLRTRATRTVAEALAQSAAKEKARLRPVTIRMQPDDLDAARRLAARKGLPYQTYIKVLLREALRRETRKSG